MEEMMKEESSDRRQLMGHGDHGSKSDYGSKGDYGMNGDGMYEEECSPMVRILQCLMDDDDMDSKDGMGMDKGDYDNKGGYGSKGEYGEYGSDGMYKGRRRTMGHGNHDSHDDDCKRRRLMGHGNHGSDDDCDDYPPPTKDGMGKDGMGKDGDKDDDMKGMVRLAGCIGKQGGMLGEFDTKMFTMVVKAMKGYYADNYPSD